jgi:hypothetical protein
MQRGQKYDINMYNSTDLEERASSLVKCRQSLSNTVHDKHKKASLERRSLETHGQQMLSSIPQKSEIRV